MPKIPSGNRVGSLETQVGREISKAEFKKWRNTKCWRQCEETGPPLHVWRASSAFLNK